MTVKITLKSSPRKLFLLFLLSVLSTISARAQSTIVVPLCSGNATADTSALTAIKTAVGTTTPATIEFPYKKDTTKLCKLNTITFPSNIALDFSRGGMQGVSGQTVTIQSPIIAPPTKQIFFMGGGGTIVATGTVYPDWWARNTTPGTTDMATAINAADASVCSGVLDNGPDGDGVSVAAQGGVRFNAAVYRVNSTLTYRGAPWRGDGYRLSLIDYRGGTAAINAVGTSIARRRLSIADLAVTGGNASAGTRGILIGWNNRSYPALSSVQISFFPSDGIYFAASTTQMSFRDVAVIGNATASGAGIGIDPSVGFVNQLAWGNPQIENNGQHGSSTGGGIDIGTSGVAHQWSLHDGILQGNKGVAEARFNGVVGFLWSGLYLESDLATTSAVDGIHVTGGSQVEIDSGTFFAAPGHGGIAFRCQGSSVCSLDNPVVYPEWPIVLSAENTAVLQVKSVGNLDPATAPTSETSTTPIIWPPDQAIRKASSPTFAQIVGVGIIQSTSAIGVFKDGSDTVGSGSSIEVANSTGARRLRQQLNANSGLDFWSFTSPTWTRIRRMDDAGFFYENEGSALTVGSNAITVVKPVHQVGAGLIKTINYPSVLTGMTITFRLIPTAAFTYDATGNILGTGTAVTGKTMVVTCLQSTGKCSMSY